MFEGLESADRSAKIVESVLYFFDGDTYYYSIY